MFPNYLDGTKVKYYTKKDDGNEFLGGSYETKRTLRKSMARNSTQFP